MIELLDRPRRLFLPTQLSGCALWLRADLGVTLNGSTVSAWANQGTAGGSCSQGTGAAQPTYAASGFGARSRPYLQFDGTGDYLDAALALAGTQWTVVAAVAYRSLVNSCTIGSFSNGVNADWNNTATAVISHVFAGNLELLAAGSVRATKAAPGTSTPVVLTVGATGSAGVLRINGAAGTPAAYSSSLNATLVRLGARAVPGASNFTAIDLAEFAIFNRALTAAEVAFVERGFGAHYGITVS